MTGPLSGLHVLELATGVAGPYAGRLYAMLGAEVVKVEPDGGDPARRLGVNGEPVDEPSPVWLHLAGDKCLGSPGDLDAALDWAHVVIDSRVRSDSVEPGRAPVLVSVTARGWEADSPGDPADEVAVQAASGLWAATSDDEDIGAEPFAFPGFQAQYLAGAYAAAAGLAALANGHRHVDVSWVRTMVTGAEGALARFLHTVSGAGEQRELSGGAFPSGAWACADGHVVPGSVRPVDWATQCEVYDRKDLVDDPRFSWGKRWENRDALRAELDPWYAAHTKREIFEAGLDAGWAVAMVMTAEDALTDRHLATREFLWPVAGTGARVPGRPWRAPGLTGVRPVVVGAAGGPIGERGRPVAPPPLDRVKVLELTWAWAGPFVGRFLGAFGADVVRLETGRYPDGWRTRVRWRDAVDTVPDGVDPDDHTWDAAALHNTVNRNKRAVSVDLRSDEGRDVFRRLLAAADVMVVNMSASVLEDRGIDGLVDDAVAAGLVVVDMPALGRTGPYRDMPGYGMLMEGMGGFAARYGRADEGARVTATYYPDAVAGIHGTLAALAHLAGGGGAHVDLSQQETLWLQFGESIARRSAAGTEPERVGRPAVEWSSWEDLYRDGTLADRGLLERVHHPVTGERDYVAIPVWVDGERLATRRPAPVFDQDTDAVLAGWAGLDEVERAELRAADVIGTVPRSRPRPT